MNNLELILPMFTGVVALGILVARAWQAKASRRPEHRILETLAQRERLLERLEVELGRRAKSTAFRGRPMSGRSHSKAAPGDADVTVSRSSHHDERKADWLDSVHVYFPLSADPHLRRGPSMNLVSGTKTPRAPKWDGSAWVVEINSGARGLFAADGESWRALKDPKERLRRARRQPSAV